jgi:hypothetical protein
LPKTHISPVCQPHKGERGFPGSFLRECLFAGFRDVAWADKFFSAGMSIPPSRRAPAFFLQNDVI